MENLLFMRIIQETSTEQYKKALSRKFKSVVGEPAWASLDKGDLLFMVLMMIIISAASRLIGEVVQSRRRPLLGPTSAFTFKTLLRHYAKRALTPRFLNVKLGPRRNYHKGRAAIRHYANQTARPL